MRIEEITGWMDRVYEINATGAAMVNCNTYFCNLGVRRARRATWHRSLSNTPAGDCRGRQGASELVPRADRIPPTHTRRLVYVCVQCVTGGPHCPALVLCRATQTPGCRRPS